MHLLVIEDEDEVVEALEAAFSSAGMQVAVRRAASRASALDIIDDQTHFDLVITDLKIPSIDHALDATPEHGREVYAAVRSKRPGIPIWVFSGYADEEFLESIIDEARQGDPFASGLKSPMIRRFRKIHLSRVVSDVGVLSKLVDDLVGAEISTSGIDLGLEPEAIRLIQLVCRRFGGTTIRVSALSPGLSSSKTLRVQVVDLHGAQVAECVLKIGPRLELEDEAYRYENNVPLALTATCFAPISAVFADGAARSVALAYTVAASDPRSLGDVLKVDEEAAIEVVHRLRQAEQQWLLGAHTEQLTVPQLCDLLSAPNVGDIADRLSGIDVDTVTRKAIQVIKAPQHGDLHVSNVLVGSGGEAVLIDYGRTGHRVSAYDAVTLELCLAFHPDGRAVAGSWPNTAHARQFDQLDMYLEGCPHPRFVRACRRWAHDVANGDREVWVAVLGYALRQLRFPDTSDELALAYAARACELLLD